MKKRKLIFKKERGTAWASYSYIIKLNGKKIGQINEAHILTRKSIDEKIQVMFSVKVEPTAEKPADFKWLVLSKKFSDFESAKNYLTENTDVVLDSVGELFHINY